MTASLCGGTCSCLGGSRAQSALLHPASGWPQPRCGGQTSPWGHGTPPGSTRPHVGALGAVRGRLWALLPPGPWRPPGKAQSVFLLRVSHFPFPADTQRRGTIRSVFGKWAPGFLVPLASWCPGACRDRGPRGWGGRRGGRVSLPPGLPDLPGPSGPRLPLASPSCTSFTRSSGDGGSQALFQKVYF